MKRIEDLQRYATRGPLAGIEPSRAGLLIRLHEAIEARNEEISAARAETVREALAKMTPEERLRLFAEFCNCGGPWIAGINACNNHGDLNALVPATEPQPTKIPDTDP